MFDPLWVFRSRSSQYLFVCPAAAEHQNFFGIDERLGPVAISFRREEKEGSSGAQNNCRIIFRTTEVKAARFSCPVCKIDSTGCVECESRPQMKTLRGSILEESVPSAARHTTPRGLTPKRLLEFIMPELNQHCLRLASNSPKVRDTLLKLDEQGVSNATPVILKTAACVGQKTVNCVKRHQIGFVYFSPLYVKSLQLLSKRSFNPVITFASIPLELEL